MVTWIFILVDEKRGEMEGTNQGKELEDEADKLPVLA